MKFHECSPLSVFTQARYASLRVRLYGTESCYIVQQCKLIRQQYCHSNINSGIHPRVAIVQSLNQSLWLHITIQSIPLLPPSFDLGFEFTLIYVRVNAEVAIDIFLLPQ